MLLSEPNPVSRLVYNVTVAGDAGLTYTVVDLDAFVALIAFKCPCRLSPSLDGYPQV